MQPNNQIRIPAHLCEKWVPRKRLKTGFSWNNQFIPPESQILDLSGGSSGGDSSVSVTYGTPWSPLEFLKRAQELEHPFASTCCPDATASAIFKNLTWGPQAMRKYRLSCFERWERLAEQLAGPDEELCASLHSDVAPFARSKRPLLTRALLREAQFPAADLIFDFLCNGWPMFGPFPATGVFPKRDRPCTTSKQELLVAAKWAVKCVTGSSAFATPPEVSAALRQTTRDELEAGECKGPFTIGWRRGRRISMPSRM